MKLLIAFFLLCLFSLNAQDQKIFGLIDNGDKKYIITEKGIIEAENDAYLQYYKSIYNDSTLTNPNTVIPLKYLKIIPIINLQDWSNLNFEIAPQVYFYDFLEHDSTGAIIINPNIENYLPKQIPSNR